MIQNGISCYGMHTNYDVCRMCDAAANRLSLSIKESVEEAKDSEFQAVKKGIGFISILEEVVSLETYAKVVQDAFGLEAVMIYGNPKQEIQKIAMVPGSGRSNDKKCSMKGQMF